MKIVIAIVAAIILAAGGVVGGIYFSKDAEVEPVQQINSLFYPMDRFIVSVGDEGYSRYLVLELSLVTKDPQFLVLLKDVSPLLRNTLVQHFATVTREQAKSMFAEVDNVQSALLEEFQQTLQKQGVVSKLDQVLVTNVFVQ